MDSSETPALSGALERCSAALTAQRRALAPATPSTVETAVTELDRAVDHLAHSLRAASELPRPAVEALLEQARADQHLVLSLLQATTEYLRFRSQLLAGLAGYDGRGRLPAARQVGAFEGRA